MPNIGVVLREEIQRLALRVSRKADGRLKKDVVHMKHQIAELNKYVGQLRRDNAKLISDLKDRLATPPAAVKKVLEGARMSPRLVRAQRARLGLSREAFAKLVGVSAGAVMNWEGGKSKPREEARAALIAVRQFGKREARWRLEALSSNGNGHSAAPKRAEKPAHKRKAAAR
jgi:DNA-binding transcriptional regulator YiaG